MHPWTPSTGRGPSRRCAGAGTTRGTSPRTCAASTCRSAPPTACRIPASARTRCRPTRCRARSSSASTRRASRCTIGSMRWASRTSTPTTARAVTPRRTSRARSPTSSLASSSCCRPHPLRRSASGTVRSSRTSPPTAGACSTDPERALEFLELEAGRRGATLSGSGATAVTTPRIFRGLERVDVNGRPSGVVRGRVRFDVDLGAPNTVQQFTSGAATPVEQATVALAPHAVVRISERGARVCVRARGGIVRNLRIRRGGRRRAIARLGSKRRCVRLPGTAAITVRGRDGFGHSVRGSKGRCRERGSGSRVGGACSSLCWRCTRSPRPRRRCRASRSIAARTPRSSTRRGREVLLRGVNVNQLGDYFQADAALPTVLPLSERDFRRISRAGLQRRAARDELVGLPARAWRLRCPLRRAGPPGRPLGGQARSLRGARHAPGLVGQAHRDAALGEVPARRLARRRLGRRSAVGDAHRRASDLSREQHARALTRRRAGVRVLLRRPRRTSSPSWWRPGAASRVPSRASATWPATT